MQPYVGEIQNGLPEPERKTGVPATAVTLRAGLYQPKCTLGPIALSFYQIKRVVCIFIAIFSV